MTTVRNLRDKTVELKYPLDARDAVIAAFAQHTRRDHNAERAEARYGSRARMSQGRWICGDWWATPTKEEIARTGGG